MPDAAKFESTVAAADTADQAEAAFEQAIAPLGYPYFDYGSLNPTHLNDHKSAFRFFSCNYYDGDFLAYLPRNWPKGDPVVPEMIRRTAPFDYVALLRNSPRTVASSIQLALLKLWRINRAWMVPLHTPGHIQFVTLYMAGENHAAAFEKTRAQVALLSALFMDRILALNTAPIAVEVAEIPQFTPEELACLTLVTQGFSNTEIARHRDISANTVRYHLKKVFRKLGVNTRTAAAARALEIGILK